MKRILLLVLTVALALSCFVSCEMQTGNGNKDDGTGGTSLNTGTFLPMDEESATYTVTKKNEDGVEIEVTVHGYKSEALKKDFYVKSNDYFLVDVKITNRSESSIYRNTSCLDCDPAHNHEIGVDISYEDYKLNTSHFGFECPERLDILEIKAGESHSWQLKLAAGTPSDEKYDLPADGKGGILLYGSEVYMGDISFDESNDKGKEDVKENGDKDKAEKDEKASEETKTVEGKVHDKSFQTPNKIENYETYYHVTGEGFNEYYYGVTGEGFTIGGGNIIVNGSGINSSSGITVTLTAISRVFDGSVFFAYTRSSENTEHECSVSADLAIDVNFSGKTENQTEGK